MDPNKVIRDGFVLPDCTQLLLNINSHQTLDVQYQLLSFAFALLCCFEAVKMSWIFSFELLSCPLLGKSGIASPSDNPEVRPHFASWRSLKRFVPLLKNVPKRIGRWAFDPTVGQCQCATAASPAGTISVCCIQCWASYFKSVIHY